MRCQFSQSVANGKLQRVHVSTEYALRSILLIQNEGCRGFSSLLWASFRLSHVSSSVCVKSSGQCSADKKRAPQGLPLVHSLMLLLKCCYHSFESQSGLSDLKHLVVFSFLWKPDACYSFQRMHIGNLKAEGGDMQQAFVIQKIKQVRAGIVAVQGFTTHDSTCSVKEKACGS